MNLATITLLLLFGALLAQSAPSHQETMLKSDGFLIGKFDKSSYRTYCSKARDLSSFFETYGLRLLRHEREKFEEILQLKDLIENTCERVDQFPFFGVFVSTIPTTRDQLSKAIRKSNNAHIFNMKSNIDNFLPRLLADTKDLIPNINNLFSFDFSQEKIDAAFSSAKIVKGFVESEEEEYKIMLEEVMPVSKRTVEKIQQRALEAGIGVPEDVEELMKRHVSVWRGNGNVEVILHL